MHMPPYMFMKIIDAVSPKLPELVVNSGDSSDSDDDDFPLSYVVNGGRPAREEYPPTPIRDYSDGEEELSTDVSRELLSRALTTIDYATTKNAASAQNHDMVTTELRLTRTILERLECSFARQEAKIDRLLDMMPLPIALQQPSHFSTPLVPTASLESAPSAVVPRPPDVLQELERLLHVDDPNVTGNDLVIVGGCGNVRMSRESFNYAKAANKPTAMALRMADKLFSPETFKRSTVHGTKEYAPLDQQILAAIKAEVITSFAYQCRSAEDTTRLWESCKTSIGKRCQNLRKGGRPNDNNNRAD